MPSSSKVKVTIRLFRDEDGYPPDDFETLWAEPVGGNQYRIDNTPFYALDLSPEDVVEAHPSPPIPLLFEKVVRKSGISVIQVVFFNFAETDQILSSIVSLGGRYEGSHLRSLYSIEVPVESDFEAIATTLEAAEKRGILEYQVASFRHHANHQC